MQLKCGFTAFSPSLASRIFGLLYCVDQESNLFYVGCLLMLLWSRQEQEDKEIQCSHNTWSVFQILALC